ncbi:unnamed protein product [Echinostoma caproni]|uniref:Helicase ATP-binding domain-containing protein n=1 Tax=Echinostoma caproni TaxID=27848 RepID=A0A183B6L9_9TREM|nr:unnamed protein product [Echinostoma caproni]
MRLQRLLDRVKSLPIIEREGITQAALEAAGLENISLRAYQLYGVSWLKECVTQNRGGILCDEMGLGKTCQIALNDEEFFGQEFWRILVVDEGHRLKNSESLLFGALNDTCKGLRFILTGTPVQNNLVELYNLLHFVAPSYFPMSTKPDFVAYFDPDTDGKLLIT